MMSLKLSSMKRELHLKPSIRSCMNRCTLRYAYPFENHLKQRCLPYSDTLLIHPYRRLRDDNSVAHMFCLYKGGNW